VVIAEAADSERRLAALSRGDGKIINRYSAIQTGGLYRHSGGSHTAL
jgi:hypothetical protein